VKGLEVVFRNGLLSLSAPEQEGWKSLFRRCFGATERQADAVFRKYELAGEGARFALLMADGKPVACYSGVICLVGGSKVFLSTDTMSDGTMPKSSVTLGQSLYERLAAEGVGAVCGFPNSNIEHLRRKYLGWEMHGAIYAFVGVPFLWRFGLRNLSRDMLSIIRPARGFFKSIPGCLRAWSPLRDYDGWPICIRFTLAAEKPGTFWIPVPQVLVAPKPFGFRILDMGGVSRGTMLSISSSLSFDSIDVP
jgi:hypothetical protein